MAFTSIILAGGFGTRLQSLVQDLPKPMAPVNGKPFLDYQLIKLAKEGCRKVILCTGHLSEKISKYYGASFSGMEIKYSHEESPLGTGGAIRQAMEGANEAEFLIMNGDSLFDIPLSEFISSHHLDKNNCSLALRMVEDASRYGQVMLQNKQIIRFMEKSEGRQAGLINGGIYMISKKTFVECTPANTAFSIEKNFFQAQCSKIRMGGYAYESYFIDIGIPQDYKQAQDDFKRFAF